MKAQPIAAVVLAFAAMAFAADDQKAPRDSRLTSKPRDLNGYFPFSPPKELTEWAARREQVRTQLLVALGLWPMPERTPLKPIIHGRIDRDDFTIEKVYFASLPGHYVTGSLYRPKANDGRRHPAVLCPHGHWANGRMYDAGEAAAKKEIEHGGETWLESARYMLQAQCVLLARMGCVVFQYDMLGYADSKAIPHRQGFTDPLALLNLQSQMGLQTWNSIRALDFVSGLPDVDPSRIGVTGGSGGGTQTFILSALDNRVTAAFPAVMVSTGMQGGCICENAPYLRVGTGNVEIAALTAPRPLGMTGANDWTIEIEKKGLPELKALYSLYGRQDDVQAWCFPQFGHNYNQVSREVMANWFNKHLKLDQPPVKERPFVPVPPQELSVFDADHPRPGDETDAEGVKRVLTEQSRKQMEGLKPINGNGMNEFRRIVGNALAVMVHDRLPSANDIEVTDQGKADDQPGFSAHRYQIGRRGSGERIPAYGIGGQEFDGTIVIWVHPEGIRSLFDNGKPTAVLRSIVDRKAAVLAIDVLGTGDLASGKVPVNAQYAGYTFGYNRPLLGEQVHDILTAIAFARSHPKTKRIELVGWRSAGSWVVLAKALAGEAVERCAADLNGFRFEAVRANDDPMMLPGSLKYGGMAAFAALCAPGDLLLHNHRGTGTGQLVRIAYRATGDERRLVRQPERLNSADVIEWLLKTP